MGTLTVDNLNVNSTATISSGVGKVLQVQSAFKSDTDDIRNSPIISLTNLLIENDVEVKLWDDNLDVNSLIGANLRVISHSIPDLGGMLAESLEMAIKDAEVDLYSLLNRLNNYEELIPIQEEVLLSAEEDLKLAQQKYELGSADILELLDAQLAVIQASSSLVSTKYDAAIQLANLDDLIGTLDKKYK